MSHDTQAVISVFDMSNIQLVFMVSKPQAEVKEEEEAGGLQCALHGLTDLSCRWRCRPHGCCESSGLLGALPCQTLWIAASTIPSV